jgi:hypothetical protein
MEVMAVVVVVVLSAVVVQVGTTTTTTTTVFSTGDGGVPVRKTRPTQRASGNAEHKSPRGRRVAWLSKECRLKKSTKDHPWKTLVSQFFLWGDFFFVWEPGRLRGWNRNNGNNVGWASEQSGIAFPAVVPWCFGLAMEFQVVFAAHQANLHQIWSKWHPKPPPVS